jgi:lipopolysaccharide export system permease protein
LSGDEKKLLKIQVTIQQKLAFPFICIIFSILGSAMGIRPQRSSKATSFGVSILLIFGYYLLIFVSSALGQARVLSPFLAGWLPNFIGFTTCIWMLLKVGRR